MGDWMLELRNFSGLEKCQTKTDTSTIRRLLSLLQALPRNLSDFIVNISFGRSGVDYGIMQKFKLMVFHHKATLDAISFSSQTINRYRNVTFRTPRSNPVTHFFLCIGRPSW